VVKAHVQAKEDSLHLIIGSQMLVTPEDGSPAFMVLVLAMNRNGYGNLSELITVARTRAEKGKYLLSSSTTISQMKNPNEDQIGMDELLDTAYPEAGHLMLLRRFGGHGRACVWYDLSGTPDERHWGGQCLTYTCPQSLREEVKRLSLPALPLLPKDWRVQFAAAG
jgi:hypothetical protein